MASGYADETVSDGHSALCEHDAPRPSFVVASTAQRQSADQAKRFTVAGPLFPNASRVEITKRFYPPQRQPPG